MTLQYRAACRLKGSPIHPAAAAAAADDDWDPHIVDPQASSWGISVGQEAQTTLQMHHTHDWQPSLLDDDSNLMLRKVGQDGETQKSGIFENWRGFFGAVFWNWRGFCAFHLVQLNGRSPGIRNPL